MNELLQVSLEFLRSIQENLLILVGGSLFGLVASIAVSVYRSRRRIIHELANSTFKLSTDVELLIDLATEELQSMKGNLSEVEDGSSKTRIDEFKRKMLSAREKSSQMLVQTYVMRMFLNKAEKLELEEVLSRMHRIMSKMNAIINRAKYH